MKYLTLLLLPVFAHASFLREVPRVSEYSFITSKQFNDPIIWRYGGDNERNLYPTGFSLLNMGPNHIIIDPPIDFMDTPFREYNFVSDDNSRRDTYLWVTDYNGSGRTSDFLESIFVFLPRVTPPQIIETDENLEVTLPTAENITFFKKYITLDTPLMTEEPVDLNPNAGQRFFPRVKYNGKGIIIRSNAKGNDPRHAKLVEISKAGAKTCFLPAKDFWTQDDFPKFKFIHDKDAFAFIEKECGSEFKL